MATWTIANLERNTADGGVVVAHWRCNEQDGDYTASAYGTCGFTYDASADGFVPFDQLTEMEVLQWVFDQMGIVQVTDIQENLHKQIEEQKAPSVISGVPW